MHAVNILDIDSFSQPPADFYCNRFSDHVAAHHAHILVPHKHNFFLTVLFTAGSGCHEIDFYKYPIGPGSVFLLHPGQTHHWELSPDAEGIIFFHSQAFFDVAFSGHSILDFPFFYSQLNPPALLAVPEACRGLERRLEELLHEYTTPGPFTAHKLPSLLNTLYIDLARLYLAQHGAALLSAGAHTGHVRKLEALIELHFRREKSPAAYAGMLAITPRHLNRLTHESLGKSTTRLIMERVVLEAKRMLVQQPGSLWEVAWELGYEDYAYFSRMFKKWTGVTPSAFGKQYRAS